MDADELRFRVVSASRKAADRARSAIATPRWRRADITRALAPASAEDSPELVAARAASNRGDWLAAHRALVAHFTNRQPRFPLDPRSLPELTARVRDRFPDAAAAARERGNRILGGHYDVLGYRDVPFGTPPAWHADPVHHRMAPMRFWSAVPYLDPQYGDHKIIWEINRHQHWLALARAHHLTGESRFYSAATAQLGDWLDSNPPLQGVNWASMLELGFRSLSWLWTLHFFAPSAVNDVESRSPWSVDLLLGLDRQLTHVERNLSRYFSPNTHLTGEALALYVAGRALPELRRGQRWASLGRTVLLEEIDRQILEDGGHAERSAHYHRYTTDFYLHALLTARLTGDPAAQSFEGAARRLSNYLRNITDDRGRLPLLGDDDGGQLFPIGGRQPSDCSDTLAAAAVILDDPSLAVGEVPEEVYWLCGSLPLENRPYQRSARPSSALADSGYYVSRSTEGDSLVFDAGRHGFLNGGHAHADALSIVLTVRGRPLLVDAGTGTYTTDPRLRDQFRSTALHNTVVVHGRSQSEMRGPFHWRSVADASPSVWMSDRRFDYAEGHHDGYRPVIHARGVLAVHGFGWIVVDHLLGTGDARADAFWHVHPDWECSQRGRSIVFREPGGLVAVLGSSNDLELLEGAAADGLTWYAPIYGQIGRAGCVRASTEGQVSRSSLTFLMRTATAAAELPSLQIDALPLTQAPPPGWHGAAFRMTTSGRQAVVLSAVEREPGSSAAGGPARLWGCADTQTDGRLAVVITDQTHAMPIVIGGGRAIATSTLASSVHRSGTTMHSTRTR